MNFENEELKLVLEALIYSSCCDVSCKRTQEDELKMAILAKKINKETGLVSTDSVIYKNTIFEQPNEADILKDVVKRITFDKDKAWSKIK